MNFGKIGVQAMKIGGKVAKFATKHAPEIALGLGAVSVFAGEFFACKSTLKAEKLLEEHTARMDIIHESEEKFDEKKYTKQDKLKDTIQVYAETGGKFAKLYAIPTILNVAGFAAIFWGFGILRSRYSLALGAFAALDAKFAQYRGKVIGEYGEDVDRRFAGLAEPTDVTYELPEKIDEDGDVVKPSQIVEARTIDIEALDNDLIGIFNWKCENKWEESGFLFNENDINQIEQRFTRDLQSYRKEHIWLNDQRKAFGLEEVASGYFYAKTAKPGACIDFQAEPFYYVFNDEDIDHQFPMMLTVAHEDEYDGEGRLIRRVYDEFDYACFKEAYINDPHSVGYLIHFDVDTDENGVPVEQFHNIFNIKK